MDRRKFLKGMMMLGLGAGVASAQSADLSMDGSGVSESQRYYQEPTKKLPVREFVER